MADAGQPPATDPTTGDPTERPIDGAAAVIPTATASPGSRHASTQLGCGRDIDDVWDAIDEPPTEHEATCPDCQTARANLTVLAQATADAGQQDRDDPALSLSPSALEAIRAVVRSEVRRGRSLPLLQPDTGPAGANLTISEQTVAAVVRSTADQIPGLEARRCQITLTGRATDDQTSPPAPDDQGGPRPSAVTVILGIAVHRGMSIPAVTTELRHRVRAALSADVGLTAEEITITAEDLIDA